MYYTVAIQYSTVGGVVKNVLLPRMDTEELAQSECQKLKDMVLEGTDKTISFSSGEKWVCLQMDKICDISIWVE